MGLFLCPLFCSLYSCLFLCQYRAVFVIIAPLYNSKSGIVIPPALVFLPSIALIILVFLCFYMNFRITTHILKYHTHFKL